MQLQWANECKYVFTWTRPTKTNANRCETFIFVIVLAQKKFEQNKILSVVSLPIGAGWAFRRFYLWV